MSDISMSRWDAAEPAPEAFPLTVLRILFFTGFAIVATVLGFVFLAPAGVVLALIFAWKGVGETRQLAHADFALRVLGILAVTAFATVATVMAFVFLAPAGVLLAAVFLWRGFGMFGPTAEPAPQMQSAPRPASPFASSGNSAFDAYREDMLRRLEAEHEAFQGFLDRLRRARDKAEFDEFMEARAARMRAETAAPEDEDTPDSPVWSSQPPAPPPHHP